MKKFKFVTIVIIMFGMCGAVNAQFTNYDTLNSGLPSNYICGGVAVDHNNHVWAGTDAGVVTFDGTDWTVFTTLDGLPFNIISCIAVDAQNNVWIGTDGDGVAKYNGSVWTTYTYADGLCDNGIHYIACGADSSVWFGSWGAGISKLEGSTFSSYAIAQGWPDDGGVMATVYYITVDNANVKWFGTDLGLVKYDDATFTLFNQTNIPDLQSSFITCVAVDDSYNKWLGVLAKGIAKLNGANAWVANYDTINGICDDGITDVKLDDNGFVWTSEYTSYGAYVEGGITKFNPATGSGISYTDAHGLANEQVFRIAIDQNDDLWLATGEGLSKFHDAVGVAEYASSEIRLFPNPTNGVLHIDRYVGSGVVEILDVTGRLIARQEVIAPVTIAASGLTKGVYFIRLNDGETIYSGKFIKE